MVHVYQLGVSISVLIIIGFRRIRSMQRRRTLEQILESYYSGLALVRYIMLNRQCSEEVAYQRLAAFVKKHVRLEDQNSIDSMLAHNRQSLLEYARNILVDEPDEIDEI